MDKTMKNRVVVTGIGIVTPLKPFAGIDAFWKGLLSGEDAIRRNPPPMINFGREWLTGSVDTSGYPGGIRPEEKLEVIAENAVRMALEDADIREAAMTGLSVGTVLGNVLYKEKRLMEGRKKKIREDVERESLAFIRSFIEKKFSLNRAGLTVSTACASGTDAIGIAARKISAGKEDVMIAGGTDILSDFAVTGFHVLQAITEEKVRPFDKGRTGLALGEGAAFMVLESERHAVKRGAKIYGRIMGYASRADANHLTGPHREGRGLVSAMEQAISEAAIKCGEIDYINAHGTGTIYNDRMETVAIKKVFGETAYHIPVNSTKSILGHSFGAAGAIEAICCLLSIKDKKIHPTINYREKDPECDLDYVPNTARTHDVNITMSLSAGFGGQNSALVIGAV